MKFGNDHRPNQAGRRHRTLEAPNGTRVVFPPGTSDMTLLNTMIKWVYKSAFTKLLTAESPFRAMMRPKPRADVIPVSISVAPPYGVEDTEPQITMRTVFVTTAYRSIDGPGFEFVVGE